MNKKKNTFKKGDIVQYKNRNSDYKFRVYGSVGNHIQLEVLETYEWFGTWPASEFEKVEKQLV